MMGFFVDGSYLRKAWQHTSPKAALRFDALRPLVEHECSDTITVAYWFDARLPDGSPHDRQQAALLRAGFRANTHYRVAIEPIHDRFGRPVEDPVSKQPLTTLRQKGVDIGLARAIERSYHADGWNHLVLSAGDGDFAELVEDLVEREQVTVTILGTDRTVSLSLRPFIDRLLSLERFTSQLALLRSA